MISPLTMLPSLALMVQANLISSRWVFFPFSFATVLYSVSSLSCSLGVESLCVFFLLRWGPVLLTFLVSRFFFFFFQAIQFVLCDEKFDKLRKEERVELLHEVRCFNACDWFFFTPLLCVHLFFFFQFFFFLISYFLFPLLRISFLIFPLFPHLSPLSPLSPLSS